MKLLVCGDRNWSNRQFIMDVIQRIEWGSPALTVIHGGCRGADTLAESICDEMDLFSEVYQADWKKHGKAAGPIRNQQMLTDGKPDVVIAFHPSIETSKGTGGMVKLARDAGLPVAVFTGSETPSRVDDKVADVLGSLAVRLETQRRM